jgi:hypothetical protein
MLGKIVETGQDTIYIKLVDKSSFKLGEEVTVSKAKKIRTPKQNALLWVFYEWVIDPFGGDLQSQGHFSKDALHDNVKEWIKMVHPQQFKAFKEFSTTTLTKREFGLFFDLIKQDLFVEILGVDISGFERDYERFSKWQEYHSGDMNDFLREKVPDPPF